MKAKILIIEDEELLLQSLAGALSEEGYMTIKAKNGKQGFDIFKRHDPDMILLDVRLPDTDGMKILKKIKESDAEKNYAVIVMTAFSGIKGAVEAIKLGADDYISKPFDIEELKIIISRCLESKDIMAEVNHIRSLKKQRYHFNNILTKNQRTREIIGIAKRVAAKSKANVLLLGESGTGKELFAKAIHYNSPRSDCRMVVVNCSALVETLIESELFGYEKGAFTGATKQKRGYFEEADKGTIFLDEIGEIDQKTQVKLLRFLDERVFQRVGGVEDIEVDVRIIAATNRNLQSEIKSGRFREDLYYRLNVISIMVPPLRERRDDIPLLVEYFIKEFNKILGKNVMGCDHEALQVLLNYDWPGNVRELRNVIERAMLLCNEEIISKEDLTPEISNEKSLAAKVCGQNEKSLDEIIRLYTEQMLHICNNNQAKAARALGISRPRLRRILNSSLQ
jgi:two-component system response regulator AtoC